MNYVKVSFRLIYLYVFILFFSVVFLFGMIVGLNSSQKILSLVILVCVLGFLYHKRRKSIYELYEISENHLKIYYCFFGLRFRRFSLQYEEVFKIQRFHYKLKKKELIYTLELNLEIEETELIIKNSHQRQLFKSFNLDTPNNNDLETFESIFDALCKNKPFG